MRVDVTKMRDEDIERVARLATDNPGDRRVWSGGDIPMTFSRRKISRTSMGDTPIEIDILDDRQKYKISVTPDLRVHISNCKRHAIKNRHKVYRFLRSLDLPPMEGAA